MSYPKYTFENRCEENLELALQDMTKKIFFNCISESEEMPEAMREFYHYLQTGEAGNSLTTRIDHAVECAKKNEKWRSEYMKEMVVFEELREEGYELGREAGEKIGREAGEKIGRETGEKIGREAGEKIGEENAYRSLIVMWLRKGKTVSEIATELGKSEEYVRRVSDPIKFL